EVPVGLAVLLLGLVPAFGLAIIAFGNFQNDRFAPLFVTPVLALPAGIVILVAAIAMRSPAGKRLRAAAVKGVVAAAALALWIQLRGAVDWLQAPYGFDVYVLIALTAAAVLYLEVAARGARPVGT